MPIYEYVCRKCGQKTEVIQNHSDPPPRKCPHCGGPVKKAFSAPAIKFKGSGFYITDYGKGDIAASKGGDGAEKSGEEKSEKAGKVEPVAGAGGDKSEKSGKTPKKESGAPAADSSGSKPAEKKIEPRKSGD